LGEDVEQIVDRILAVFDQPEGHAHYGEGVSEREHALQAAQLAEQAGAPPSLVAACLLHDIGHLLHGLGEDIAARGIDAKHEAVGAAYLARYFTDDVVGPVALHVDAKRYRVAADPPYAATLSPASVRSLALQGGPMDADEMKRYIAKKHAIAALRLREWDDLAKVVGRVTPAPLHFRAALTACLRSPAEAGV
jgi:[1-hydroxy-2-(trimethylamino)ethyl]phosphonate dioxygenase